MGDILARGREIWDAGPGSVQGWELSERETKTATAYAELVSKADAEIARLREENERLREALTPFAFLHSETTQDAWECVYQDRFKDWIDFYEIEAARAALQENKDG